MNEWMNEICPPYLVSDNNDNHNNHYHNYLSFDDIIFIFCVPDNVINCVVILVFSFNYFYLIQPKVCSCCRCWKFVSIQANWINEWMAITKSYSHGHILPVLVIFFSVLMARKKNWNKLDQPETLIDFDHSFSHILVVDFFFFFVLIIIPVL